MSESVAVHIDCPCPERPHPDGDDIFLRAKLGLQAGIAIQKLMVEANQASERMDSAEQTGLLAESYLLHGVESWTLLDADGKPVPVTKETIRSHLLDDFTTAAPVADVADGLYMGPVLLPLLKKTAASLTASPTNGSTSQTKKSATRKAKKSGRSTRSSSPRPTPLKPSSTSTTQTASTGKTLVALERASTG